MVLPKDSFVDDASQDEVALFFEGLRDVELTSIELHLLLCFNVGELQVVEEVLE